MPETSPARRYRGLQHVNVPSTDLDRSREFYRDQLGLPELPGPAFDVPGVWIAVGPNQAIHITQISEKEPTAAYHFALEVDRLDPLLDELAARGLRTRGCLTFPVQETRPRSVIRTETSSN